MGKDDWVKVFQNYQSIMGKDGWVMVFSELSGHLMYRELLVIQ
jgi:hypothetical protein